MQFNKNTSSGKKSIIGLVVKSIFGLVIALGVVLILNSIDFPAPKKEIEKIIPNENFKIVK
ncbi:hypothetical protein [Candidatus Pelagibacter sp. HIMB1611]|uniref:hypothetical protein n=1 Tax=unclassified Candidatus Pelagibacter TaxID=2647897 RepID=UPI003F82EC98